VRNAAVAELVGRIRERVRGTRFEHDDQGAVYVWHDLLLLGQLGRDACRERLLTWLPALAAAKASSDEPRSSPPRPRRRCSASRTSRPL